MKNGLATILLSIALCAGPASAAELAGVSMPGHVTVGDKELVLNGLGLREATALKVDVYVGGLYLEEKSSDAEEILFSEQIKRIDMQFVRKVSSKKIQKGWSDALKANSPDKYESFVKPLGQLNGWMDDMQKGDMMSFTATPGRGLEVVVRGDVKGVIEDESFAKAFWSIWLGPEPPNTGLKEGLLGK
jgi:hypothetical protein